MNATGFPFQWLFALLLMAGRVSVMAAPAPSPVTQAWAAQIQVPPLSFYEAGGMTLGPSGDVFLAGHVRFPGMDHDILVTRHNTAGTMVWQRRFEPAGGPGDDEMATAVVAQGTNIYVAGTTTSTNGGQDFLTLKYDDTGALEWAARFDGAGHFTDLPSVIAADGQGNVLVGGDSIGANGTSDLTVLKYGPTGNLLWTYHYDGSEPSWDRIAGMRVDAVGNVHLTGSVVESDGRPGIVTLKLNPGGQVLWIAREHSGHVWGVTASDMDLDSDGNVVTVGNERSHCVTWMYDTSGHRQWSARYWAEEPASMQSRHVRFDGGGNVILAAILYGSGTNDTVLVKYAPDGRQLWASRISDPQNGVTHLQTLAVDAGGNAYLAATPATDVVTVKVGADGTQLWSATYNSSGFFYDYARFLEVDSSGNVFMAGRSVYFSEFSASLVKYTQQPVAGMPIATVAPVLQIVAPGTKVVFTAGATGTGPMQFQWRMHGRPLPDATNATLLLSNVQAVHRGDYSVVVSNSVGSTISAEARLTVRIAPEVFINPTNTTAYLGTDAAFLATVAGNDFVTLQWRHNGTNIPGATNELLRLGNLGAAASGAYDFVASTVGGTSTSSVSGLRISSAVALVGSTSLRSYFASWDNGPLLHVLPSGDSIIVGNSNHVARGTSILVRKQNAAGALLWSTGFDSTGFTNSQPTALALDGAGNIYVTGVSLQPYGSGASGLLKYSPDGQLLWFRSRDGTNQSGIVMSLSVDPEGNSTIGTLGYFGTTLTRYSSAGEVQWSSDDPSNDAYTLAVAVDASGNSYIGTTLRLINTVNLRKVNAAGATEWTRTFADGLYQYLTGIAVDAAGNLIAAGTGYSEGVPDSRMFVLKYSPAGDRLWVTRTGGDEIRDVRAMKVGSSGDITLLTASDDDYTPEQSGLTQIGADGQLRYRISEPELLVSFPGTSELALDDFGNACVTGYAWRPGTGGGVTTARYDAHGNRSWLIYHTESNLSWTYGIAVGADAAGDIRVLASQGSSSDSYVNLRLLHYRQRDPAGTLRVQLVRGAAGTFHLSTTTAEQFRIEASTDLREWIALDVDETRQLLQPGGTTFSTATQRFFRLITTE